MDILVKKNTKKAFRELKSFLLLVLLALFFRSFIYEPYTIPSGSMKPNLLIGDYLFVAKYPYGFSRYSLPFGPNIFSGRIAQFKEPKRGEIVIFKPPHDLSINYVKRLIAVPGDKVALIGGEVYLNDQKLSRIYLNNYIDDNGEILKRYVEFLPSGESYDILKTSRGTALDNFGPITVPEGMYFFLGDNRDNSNDSRAEVGLVPAENLIGKAHLIFFSTPDSLWKIWHWPFSLRYDRLVRVIN